MPRKYKELPEKQLNPKQEAFCQAYANIDSDTYNFKAKSAEDAGYKSPGNTASNLFKMPLILTRIRQIHDSNVSRNLGRLLSRAEHIYKESMKHKDRTNANTAIKLQMQCCGFLRESDSPQRTEQVKLTEQQAEEAKKFAQWRLKQQLSLGNEILEDSLGESQ